MTTYLTIDLSFYRFKMTVELRHFFKPNSAKVNSLLFRRDMRDTKKTSTVSSLLILLRKITVKLTMELRGVFWIDFARPLFIPIVFPSHLFLISAKMSELLLRSTMYCHEQNCHEQKISRQLHSRFEILESQRKWASSCWYGVATMCRLLKVTGLFCKRAL